MLTEREIARIFSDGGEILAALGVIHPGDRVLITYPAWSEYYYEMAQMLAGEIKKRWKVAVVTTHNRANGPSAMPREKTIELGMPLDE